MTWIIEGAKKAIDKSFKFIVLHEWERLPTPRKIPIHRNQRIYRRKA